MFQESPEKPPEGHMLSIEKAEWEQVRHTKGLQQPQSTGESLEPFIRLTGLPGSEQGAPQIPTQLGDTLKVRMRLSPYAVGNAYIQSRKPYRCLAEMFPAQDLWRDLWGANAVAQCHSQDKSDKFSYNLLWTITAGQMEMNQGFSAP